MEVIKKFKTPFYIMDVDILRERITYLKNTLSDKIDLCYAIKANTFIADYAAKEVARLEICSPGEYEICEKLGVPPTKMVISGVNKEEKFIKKLVKKDDSFIFTIESLEQYKMLKKLAKDKKIQVLIRITSGNQFGVSKCDALSIIEHNKNLNILGIEYFSGTQKNSLKKIEREFKFLKEFIESVKEKYHFEIRELEYGTGFPVSYFEGEEFDEEEYLLGFKELILGYFGDLKLTIEVGRSIAATCGKYYTKVVDLKTNEVGNFAIVDGGMNHLVYYGAMMGMRVPICEILPKRSQENAKNWCICGSLCTINDIMIKQLPITNLRIGDVLIFKNTGAYSMTEGISLFLSRELPKIIIKENDDYKIVRKNIKTSMLNMPK